MTKVHGVLIGFWFGLSAIFGWLLAFWVAPPLIVNRLYGWVEAYIENFSAFGWSVSVFIVLLPVVVLVFLRTVKFDSYLPRAALIALIAVAVSSLCGLVGLVEMSGGNAFSRLVRLLMQEFDWLGALMFFYLIGYSLLVSITLLFSIARRGREDV
ncbi:hypothetical protein J3Q00_12675 [Pseudomonas sp. D2-3]